MIFGSQDIFALKLDRIEKWPDGNILANLMMSIGGDDVGDEDMIGIMAHPAYSFQHSAQLQRTEPKIFTMPKLEAFEAIKRGIDQEETDKGFLVFDICRNFSECFDGEKVFLVDNGKHERFLWKKFRTEDVRELIVPYGTYQHVAGEFAEWHDAMLQT